MAPAARLTLLGGFTLKCEENSLQLPKTPQRLLAFLALRRQTTRGHAIGVLWPEVDEKRAFGRLRTALWRLHRAGAPVVAAHGEWLSLHDWVEVDVDDLVETTRNGSPGEVSEPGACELLPGWYDDWVLVERERLRQRYLHNLEQLAAEQLAAGDYARALETTLAALRAEPLRESPHRLLVEIHLAEGNYCEAVNAYQICCDLLRRELGVPPSARLRQLLGQGIR